MVPGWEDLELRDGFAGVRAVVERDVVPAFENLPAEARDRKGVPKEIDGLVTQAFLLFIAAFMSTFLWLPDTALGNVARFILFPVFFAAALALVFYLNRKKLGVIISRGSRRMMVRQDAISSIAAHLNLQYVTSPGGLPAPIAWLSRQSWAPEEVRDLSRHIDDGGQMIEAVETARKSGILEPNVIVLGNEQQRETYRAQSLKLQQIEDGFHGERGGIKFDLFEWVESVSEGDNIYHLVIVLKAPVRLHGTTELRARKLGWTAAPNRAEMVSVDLGPKAFHDLYRLRSTDQVEARTLFNPAVIERVIELAHGGKFRGIASDDYLVFDVSGANRFVFIDPASGIWSDEMIRRGLGELAEALELVDALIHAFMLRSPSRP